MDVLAYRIAIGRHCLRDETGMTRYYHTQSDAVTTDEGYLTCLISENLETSHPCLFRNLSMDG